MTTLVLGSTGRLGPHVVTSLQKRGADVRVLLRDAARTSTFDARSVDVRVGDLDDDSSVTAALEGVVNLFLLTPHGPRMAAQQVRLIELARERHVRVVKLSGTSAGIHDSGPDACRQHWQVEQRLHQDSSPFVILRPNAFMQGLVAGLVTTAMANGTLANPLGRAGLSLIDCADIGDCAAEVLLNSTHDGSTYVLTGPSAPTYPQLADLIGHALQLRAAVVDSSPELAGDAMRSRGASAWEAEHLVEMLRMFRQGASEYVTPDVEHLTGHPPRSVADFLTHHVQLLATT